MAVIQQQTWNEVAALTGDNLSANIWYDFRLFWGTSEAILKASAASSWRVNPLAEISAMGIRSRVGKSRTTGSATLEAAMIRVRPFLAVITALAELNASTVDSANLRKAMLAYYPQFLRQEEVFKGLISTQAVEHAQFRGDIGDGVNQFFIETATETALPRWESIYKVESVAGLTIEQRREQVKAKMQAGGTCTKALLTSIAAAFSNGEVEVIEHPADYSFEIKFTGTKGIPTNIDGLTTAIEDAKPAHLGFSLTYTYNTADFLASLTWDQVAVETWESIMYFS